MSLHDMEDEFSEEFNMALKVVLKVEIQSLLDRLSQTGEETVLLFASADDQCTDHLASSKAKSFVDTTEIGTIKDKFLNYLMTGSKPTVAGRPTPQQNAVLIHPPVTIGAHKNAGPVHTQIPAGNMNMQLSSLPVKRSLDLPACSQSEADAKKRKLDTVNVQINSQTKIVNQSSQASVAMKPQPHTTTVSANTTPQKQQVSTATQKLTPSQVDTKLKTTKVVTSGGFTEERLSSAEFEKFLQQYKPEIPDSNEDSNDTVSGSHVQQPGTGGAGQQPQRTSAGNLATPGPKSGTTLDLKQPGPRSPQPVPNVGQAVKKEAVKDNLNSAQNVKTLPRKISDTNSGQVQTKLPHNENSAMKTPTKSEQAGTNKIGTKIPLDDIENIDTETLVKLTKAKHLENMSEADRQLQEKLGQLSSKTSWVVEYPKNSKDGASASKQSQGSSGKMPMVTANVGLNKEASMMTGNMGLNAGGDVNLPEEYDAFEDEEEEDEEEYDEDEEEYDEDGEFNEEGLDEEDREALRKIREDQMKKLGLTLNMGANMRGPHFNMNDPRMEGYHIEQDENYEEGEYDYAEFGEGEGEGKAGHFPEGYGDSSPHKDMFLMMGSLAKCLICNKIVRNSEMRQHNEMHEQEMEEEEEEGEGEYDEEDGEEEHGAEKGEFDNHEEGEYGPEQGEYSGQGDQEEYEEGEMEGEEDKGEYSEMAYTEGMEAGYSEHPDQLDNQFTAEPVFTAEKLDTDILVAEKIPTAKEKDQKVECTMCNKKLANARNLKKHMEKIHGQSQLFVGSTA